MKDNLKQQFNDLVLAGRIEALCQSRNTLNIPLQTMGGAMFWESFSVNGWQLQINTIAGNWRILSPDKKRQAWGITEVQLESFLNDRPTSIVANYLDEGYTFSRYAGSGDATVVLLHGWGVRSSSMDDLAKMLNNSGYSVLNYDYPSSEKSIEQHSEIFLSIYRKEKIQGKIHFLTHSMGGLILRYALSKMTQTECLAIHSIVMLGPPNKGSCLAYFGAVKLIKDLNFSLKDMIPNSESLNIPKPQYLPPVGIIAGAQDGKVSINSTALPDGMPYQHVIIDSTHPNLRLPEKTGSLILSFL